MNTCRVLILGAGGHAQVVADIFLCARDDGQMVEPVGYLDENPALWGSTLVGLPVLGSAADLTRIEHDAVIVAIGDNRTRQYLAAKMLAQGEALAIARHPSSVIARNVVLRPGVMVCAGVVVNAGGIIGMNTILNTSCSVDHHVHIGDCVHIAPGSRLGGEVTVAEGALVGIGATVMPRCSVGAWSTIGAGACVTKPVPPGMTVIGIPARPLQRV